MEDNPYSAMVETMRQAGGGPAAAACLGRVLQAEPLRVLAEGNALDAGRLLADPRLLRGDTARLRLEEPVGGLAVSAACPSGSHDSLAVSGGSLETAAARLEPGFRAGDQLLLLPIEERQRYVVVCKVVAV